MGIRKIVTLLFCVFISAYLLGQSNSNTLEVKTVLFKVTKQNSNKTSYLFGTHHAFGKSFFDSLTKANNALASCDLLIKENLNQPGRMAEDIINHRTTVTKWNKFLNNNDLEFIRKLFAASPTDYNKITPTEMYVFLNRHYNQQICLNKSAEDTSLSLDNYISSIALQQHMELLGLETTEEQIVLINKDVEGMPRKIHKKRLANIIEKIRTENSNYCEESMWYANMEIDFKLNEPCTNTLMLTNRNNKWMTTLSQKLETNNCFIAVGLSHLMYKCGLLNQLRELGYTITAIEVK